MFKKILCFTIFFISAQLFGQHTLIGKVVSENNFPIEYIRVQLLKNDSVVVFETFTDNDGVFKIDNFAGNFILRLKNLENIKIEQEINIIGKVDLGKIVIDEDEAIALDEANIKGQRKLISHRKNGIVFHVENSSYSKGYNGIDLLRATPLIFVDSKGIVKLQNRNATFYINGRKVKLSDQELSDYILSLTSDEVKEIEIKSNNSASEDSNVEGGIINIILKSDDIGFRVIYNNNYQYKKNSFSNNYGSLNLNYSAKKIYFNSSFNYSANKDSGTTKGVFNYVNDNQQVNKGAFVTKKRTPSIKIGTGYFINNKSSIDVEGYFQNSKSNFNNYEELQLFSNENFVSSENTSLNNSDIKTLFLTLNYNLKLDTIGSYLKIIGDVGKNDSEKGASINSRYSNIIFNNDNMYNSESNSNYKTIQVDYVKNLKLFTLSLGGKVNFIKRNNELKWYELNGDNWDENFETSQSFINKETIAGGYFLLEKEWKKHYLNLGLRSEFTKLEGQNLLTDESIDNDNINWFPNLYYRYNLNDNLQLSLSYNKYIFRPSFNDLTPYIIKQNDYLYQIGNPNLRPFKKDRVGLNVSLKKHNLSFYGELSDNVIHGIYYNVDEINYHQVINDGKESKLGMDYSFQSNINKWWDINLNTGLYYTEYISSSDMKFSGSSFYNSIYSSAAILPSLKISINSNYYYKGYFRNIETSNFFRFDFSLRKSFFNNHIVSQFSISDLFNTARDKNLSKFSIYEFDFYQKTLTRTYMLSVQFSIDNKKKLKTTSLDYYNETRGRL